MKIYFATYIKVGKVGLSYIIDKPFKSDVMMIEATSMNHAVLEALFTLLDEYPATLEIYYEHPLIAKIFNNRGASEQYLQTACSAYIDRIDELLKHSKVTGHTSGTHKQMLNPRLFRENGELTLMSEKIEPAKQYTSVKQPKRIPIVIKSMYTLCQQLNLLKGRAAA